MTTLPATLPRSLVEAASRGARCRCPRCDGARLFRRWLVPVEKCGACGQDWTLHRADDFPPYIAIFVTGHLMVPLVITLVAEFALGPWQVLGLILPLSVAMMLAILQPAKGAVIAMQYWLGMGGFTCERAPPPRVEPGA